jgi:6-phosphogluconolactonase
MNKILQKTHAGLATMALAITLGLSVPAEAVVYTASNEATGNQVIAFEVDRRGHPIEIGRFDTQGLGTGTPLGNQGAIALDASDRWMFVVNPGDGSLTSFRLQPSGLEFVNRVPSGGFRPLSVTVFGTLVYVLNEGDAVSADPSLRFDNVSGFRFTGGGVLVPIPDSSRMIADMPTAPAQVGFNRSGTVLLITEKATNTLTTFVVQADGTPAETPLRRPSAVPTPFGFAFGDRDYVFVTEANGGGVGVTASYRVDRETGSVSSLVGIVEQGNATCWTVLSNDQTIGYSTNTASGTVSLFRINFDGTLAYFFRGTGDPQGQSLDEDSPIPSGNGVRDAALTQANDFLFTLNNGDGQIRAFSVSLSGAIVRRGTAPIPASATGLIAR